MKKKRSLFCLAVLILLIAVCMPSGAAHADENGTEYETMELLQVEENALPSGDVLFLEGTAVRFNGTIDEYLASTGKQGPKRSWNINGDITNTDDGSGSYGYNSLSTDEKGLYAALKTQCAAFIASDAYAQDFTELTGEVSARYDSGKFTESNYVKVYTAFLFDNPQYYWIDKYYSYVLSSGTGGLITIQVDTYYYSAANRKTADAAIKDIGDEWIEELKGLLKKENGEYLAAVHAHDLIINQINYAYEAPNVPQTARWAHCLAGVFTGQGAVCEGYARAYQYLLDKVGVDNVYIVGTATTNNGSGGHAWNAVNFDGTYWLVDVTWDDLNGEKTAFNEATYRYFCMPASKFSKTHNPDNMGHAGMYELPQFGDSFDKCYFNVFKGYTTSAVNEQNASTLKDAALGAQPEFADYVFFAVPDASSVSALANTFGESLSVMKNTEYGYIAWTLVVKITNPAENFILTPEEAEIKVGGTVTITAILPEGSDDRVVWRLSSDGVVATLTTNGKTATVYGRRNGYVTLYATTYAGRANFPCFIKVGDGGTATDATIWQNGAKDYKQFTLKATIKPSSWKDGSGKTKQGKLVWMASDTNEGVVFDTEKHKAEKTKSTLGSVNNKGVVKAKKEGIMYVYCCDTGSCTYETFVIEVLGSPSKLYLSKVPGSTEKDDIVKSVALPAGSTSTVYITPFMKNGTADLGNEYTVEFAKLADTKYVSVSEVMLDENCNPYFTVTGKDVDTSKAKPAKVKLNVVCKQSGKKVSMTVAVYNQVKKCQAVAETSQTSTGSAITLSKKKATLKLKLDISTALGKEIKTTDQLKVCVGRTSVTIEDGKKIVADKGATIKAKLDKKTLSLTLTASKDAGETAVVAVVCKNPVTKKLTVYNIVRVDKDGNVTLVR